MLQRSLTLPNQPAESFFLWGPRQVGKSSLLHERYPQARRIDLLLTEEFLRYLERPGLLRDELRGAPPGTLTVIDEASCASAEILQERAQALRPITLLRVRLLRFPMR